MLLDWLRSYLKRDRAPFYHQEVISLTSFTLPSRLPDRTTSTSTSTLECWITPSQSPITAPMPPQAIQSHLYLKSSVKDKETGLTLTTLQQTELAYDQAGLEAFLNSL